MSKRHRIMQLDFESSEEIRKAKIKNQKNEFIMGVEKYFKKNKILSDKQFECLINWHQEKQNKDE